MQFNILHLTYFLCNPQREYSGDVRLLISLVFEKLKFPSREHALETKNPKIPLSIVAGEIFGGIERGKAARCWTPAGISVTLKPRL